MPAKRVFLFLNFLLLTVCPEDAGSSGDLRGPAFTDIGQFNYAAFLMDEGRYNSAAREFSRLIEMFPSSTYKEKAQFMLAESYRGAGRYRKALENYRLFLANFKDSPFVPRAESLIKELGRLVGENGSGTGPVSVGPASTGGRPMRAVQISYMDLEDPGDLDREFSRLKKAGIDTVIFRVFHNRGDRFYRFFDPRKEAGVYFRTDRSPVVADILSPVVLLAHRNGLRLFAWMTTRYADYGLEDRPDLACKGFDPVRRVITRCRGLDIFNEEVVEHLEGLYTDLASYDIDGILFQDDLVLRQTEGFGPEADRAFRREAGSSLNPEDILLLQNDGSIAYTPDFYRWARWKNRRLLNVAARLKRAVRRVNPDVEFAINLMYESVTSPAHGLAWLSQDLEEAVKKGFDYYSIMAYHRQMADELEKGHEEIKDLIKRMVVDASAVVGDPSRVLIKVQTVDWKTGEHLSNGEVVELLREIGAVERVGLAVFPYRDDFPFYELGRSDLAFQGESKRNALY